MTVLQLNEWATFGATVRDEIDRTIDVIAESLATSDERIVLDLHASGDYQDGQRWLSMGNEVYLEPGQCVRVRVRERVSLSVQVCGVVVSRASLAADGLLIANVKVDPQFLGRPEIAVANTSNQRIRLVPGMAFASLMLMKLETPMTEVLPRGVTVTAAVQLGRWDSRLRRSVPYLVTGILTLLASGTPEIVKAIF